MKKIVTIIAVLIGFVSVQAQPFNQEINSDTKSPTLLGKINQEGLSENTYGTWFQKNKTNYKVNSEIISEIKDDLSNYTIKLFMGTWCGDSKREVPKFYKVLEEAEFPLERLTSIAVSRDKNTYKQSPGGEEEGLNVHRVPTFIFYKDGKEVNRIVESPVQSIEKDLQQILQGEYQSNYYGVSVANNYLNEWGLKKFSKKKKKLVSELSSILDGIGELNTYSYTMFHAGHHEEAIEVAKLNTMLFPKEARTYLRVANQLKQQGDKTEAAEYYRKVLSLDPENKTAKQALTEISNNALSRT